MTELLKELSPPAWRLLKSDEFNGAELGQTMWSLCREGPSAWNRHKADRPMYLILDMQLGGSWAGEVDISTLPVTCEIDWIRIFEPAS